MRLFSTLSFILSLLLTAPSATAQVSVASELRDVQSSDWAYDALRSLVEMYACVGGYPEATFRQRRSLEAIQFAAILQACITELKDMLGENGGLSEQGRNNISAMEARFQNPLGRLRGDQDLYLATLAQLGLRPVGVRRIVEDGPPTNTDTVGDAAGFARRLSVALTFGTNLREQSYRVNTGGGTFQDFRTRSASSIYTDIRFVWNDLIDLTPGGANGRTRITGYGGFGFGLYDAHNDYLENINGPFNGVRNLTYEGGLRVEAPFVTAGLTISNPNLWNPFGNGGSSISLGANVWLGSPEISQTGGGFSNASDETPFSVEAFYRFQISDRVFIAPGMILLFNVDGEAGSDEVLVGAVRTTFTF